MNQQCGVNRFHPSFKFDRLEIEEKCCQSIRTKFWFVGDNPRNPNRPRAFSQLRGEPEPGSIIGSKVVKKEKRGGDDHIAEHSARPHEHYKSAK